MNKVRILHVINKMQRAGAETLIMNIYRNIDRNKLAFDFVVHTYEKCDYDEKIKSLGGKIYHAPRFKIYNYIKYKKFWQNFFKEHNEYKIIHGHIRSCAKIYLKEARKKGLFTIIHSHNTNQKSLRGILHKLYTKGISKYADYCFGCSEKALIDAFGKKTYKNKKNQIIKNGIDLKEYQYSESKALEYKKKLNLENNFVIGHIGRFTKQKNHKFLIDIFKEILKIHSSSILLLIGTGELEKKIKKYVKRKGLAKKVKFLGIRKDINNILNAMDVFVFPSLYEGFGIALLEAQASGLKCFVSQAIVKEAIISDNAYKISLKYKPQEWANIIVKNGIEYNRKNLIKKLENKGFNIIDTAKKLEKFYLSKIIH